MLKQEQLDKFLGDNLQKQTDLSNSLDGTVTVRAISDWSPTKATDKSPQPLQRKMVITDKGNFWILASAIKNMPTDFKQAKVAKATFVQNGEWTNLRGLEFDGLKNETALMIREMPAGTALFAAAV